jgi:hypothetical protein
LERRLLGNGHIVLPTNPWVSHNQLVQHHLRVSLDPGHHLSRLGFAGRIRSFHPVLEVQKQEQGPADCQFLGKFKQRF